MDHLWSLWKQVTVPNAFLIVGHVEVHPVYRAIAPGNQINLGPALGVNIPRAQGSEPPNHQPHHERQFRLSHLW